jgi:O-antigen/teichoic acid export membrane protein
MNLKLFGKNAVIYAVGTTGLRASGFLLIPIYTHFLPLNDYGLLSTLLLTINFMVTLIDLGLRSGLMRFVTQYKSENKLKYLLGSLLLLNIITGAVVSLSVFFFLKPVFVQVLHTENVSGYILLTCLASVVQSLSINITSYYRAENLGMKYMIMNLSVAGILILSNFVLFILLDAGIQGALMAYVISYGTIGIFVAVTVFPKTGIAFSKEALKQLFKYSAPLIFATSGFSIMDTTAAYFLSFFTSLEQVGIYNLGNRLAQITSMIIVLPFQLAYEPFLFANLDNPDIKEMVSKLTTYILLAFTIVASLTVFIFRDFITLISPPEYFSAYYIIFLLVPGTAMSGFFYIGQSLVHITRKTHITGITVAAFSACSVLLNYFLIQHWGMTGMIITYNFVWVSIALILMKTGLKAFPVKLEKMRLFILSLTFAAMLFFIYLMHDTSTFLYYSLIPALFLLVLFSYYFGGFFDNKEKQIIGKVIAKAGSLFKSLKTENN